MNYRYFLRSSLMISSLSSVVIASKCVSNSKELFKEELHSAQDYINKIDATDLKEDKFKDFRESFDGFKLWINHISVNTPKENRDKAYELATKLINSFIKIYRSWLEKINTNQVITNKDIIKKEFWNELIEKLNKKEN
ncbi:hypothetical protein [Mycoplasma sp. Mirounga ES2805-ORL]|uniref:hypothetical protein n=1 Tax=Mycoplasma sp. Mirounga ES2805-ORL TaxID=754514 RepID=UPI00197C1D75|nr:hypothetical protein [Mycoplasma sp. Mirounga ES2805-ORL]QSF13881.1 hypothetical protein JXZ90_01095 [Mycoplasma sp. Mirounga ES2805-ORL]